MDRDWRRTRLGATGPAVTRLGLGSSYGLSGRDVERAFDEHGVNYFYWGSWRRPDFGRGLARLAQRERDSIVIVIQTYTRVGGMMRRSLERALRQLGIEAADYVLLGWWNRLPSERILEAARALRGEGKARQLMISCHHRPQIPEYLAHPDLDAVMVRYNAAHPGAIQDVFPHVPGSGKGVVSYTNTCWGKLLDPECWPAEESGPTAADCYRFALSRPEVDLALCGPKNGAELDEALIALERGPMDQEELEWMRRVGAAVRR